MTDPQNPPTPAPVIDPEKYARDRKRIAEAGDRFIADNRELLARLAAGDATADLSAARRRQVGAFARRTPGCSSTTQATLAKLAEGGE